MGSRLSALFVRFEEYGWTLKPSRICCPNEIFMSKEWPDVREGVISAYKHMCYKRLVESRPKVLLGLTDVNHKEHARFLQSLTSYHASIAVRIWTGCAMTLSHKKTLESVESAQCPCGEGEQNIPHIAYACGLSPPTTPAVRAWSLLPPCPVRCFPLSTKAPRHQVAMWREACMHIIRALASMPEPIPTFDWKNHCVAIDATMSCAYCIKCLVARSVKDQKYTTSRACVGEVVGHSLAEGEYVFWKGHLLRCMIVKWKRMSQRPALRCVKSALTFWPSSLPPSGPCAL